MTEEQAAKCLAQLRAHGHDAHLHPVTRRVAVWLNDRWWHVVGGSFEQPSLIMVKEPVNPVRQAGFYWLQLQIREGPPVIEKRVAWWMAGLWWLPGDETGHYDGPLFRVLSGPLEPPA